MVEVITLIGLCLFSLTAAADTSSIARVAFGSCYKTKLIGVWPLIQETQPDQLILLGDNIYADKFQGFNSQGSVFKEGGPKEIQEQYDLLNNDTAFADMIDALGGWDNVIATYDDHDYGINNGDKTFEHRNSSMSLFWDFTKTPTDSPKRQQDSVYSSKVYTYRLPGAGSDGEGDGEVEVRYKIIVMDSRSNKDPMGTPNGDFLGEEQWEWLYGEMNDPTVDAIFLGSSILVLQENLIEEDWAEFPAARERLLKLVHTANQFTNVFMLSGDVHRADISQATCTHRTAEAETISSHMWEFTSSGLSHTASLASPYKQAGDRDSRSGIVRGERGQMVVPEVINWKRMAAYYFYMALGVHAYREKGSADTYQGLNFALMDVVRYDDLYSAFPTSKEKSISNGTSSQQEGQKGSNEQDREYDFGMILRVINGESDQIITRRVPLRRRSNITPADTGIAYPHITPLDIPESHFECAPVWGKVPWWRVQLIKVLIVALPLFTFGTPLIAILWFIIASIVHVVRIIGGKRRSKEDKLE